MRCGSPGQRMAAPSRSCSRHRGTAAGARARFLRCRSSDTLEQRTEIVRIAVGDSLLESRRERRIGRHVAVELLVGGIVLDLQLKPARDVVSRLLQASSSVSAITRIGETTFEAVAVAAALLDGVAPRRPGWRAAPPKAPALSSSAADPRSAIFSALEGWLIAPKNSDVLHARRRTQDRLALDLVVLAAVGEMLCRSARGA